MTQEGQSEILNRTIKSLRRMHEEMDEDELKQRSLTVINVGALCFPRVPAEGALFEVVIDMISSAYHSDDLFDNEDEFPFKVNTSFVYKKYHLWEAAFQGNYEKLHEIAASVPGWESGYTVFIGALKKIQGMIPSANVEHILRSLFVSGEAVFLNLEAILSKDGEQFSEEAKRAIRGHDAGLGVFAEIGAVLSEADLPERVRKSLLFRMLTESMRIFGGLINDILGLNKDIRTCDTNGTVVLRRVVEQGMSLQQAVDLEAKRLRDVLNDIKICSKKLVAAFPDEITVSQYAQFAVEFCDGQIYANILGSLHKSRYGSIKMEIVPQ